jgi:hypothetical protein
MSASAPPRQLTRRGGALSIPATTARHAIATGPDLLPSETFWACLSKAVPWWTAMLLTTTLNKIRQVIDQSNYFKSGDFLITTNDNDYESKLRLELAYEGKYFLEARIPIKKSPLDNTGFDAVLRPARFVFSISGETSPGDMSTREPFECENADGLQKIISQWLARVRTQLQMAPAIREVDLQREKLEQMAAEMESFPDEYFSKQEADALRQRLDDLESRLTDNLNQKAQDKDKAQKEMSAIHSDIEMLKEALDSLKKPGWVKALTVRLLMWGSVPENRELLNSGAHIAKDLILEAGKHLPQH